MTDESASAMDKKNSTRSQGSTKPSGSDSKKTTETQNGKQFPRSARKREPIGGAITKNEVRRPLPQKSKTADKRPKPRGMYYGSKRDDYQMIDPEFEAEYGSVFLAGSKKQSLNHLLNFHYETKAPVVSANQLYPAPSKHTPTKALISTQAHKYNKEQFLQANCQFVVRADGDYGCYMGDPDQLVDWTLVELIRLNTRETIVCPICLYPPTAGKITRCGHIYCWACVLHYLALSDKTWRKCPICYEAIHRKDLKSVEWIDKTSYFIGEEITLQLMKREKGSLVAAPVSQFDERMKHQILELKETKVDTFYSKLLLVSPSDIDEIIEAERSQLLDQVNEFKGCPELCFVEQALELLNQRKNNLNPNVEAVPEPVDVVEETEAKSPETETPESVTEEFAAGNDISVDDLCIESLKYDKSSKFFYFYQATDGQHVYMHAMNIKMLEMSYGALENCPLVIRGRILEKENGSMTTELRRRLRYMQHLPVTCQFEVVEIDLAPPLVSPTSYDEFRAQIEARRKRRLRAAKAEKKREKEIEEVERKQFGRNSGPDVNLKIESHYHFPLGLDLPGRPQSPDYVGSQTSSRSSSPVRRSVSPISIAVAALSLDPRPQDPSTASFAQTLKEGKTIRVTGDSWPSVGGHSRRQRQESVTCVDSDPETAFSPPARPSFNIAEALEAAARIEKEPNTGKKRKKKQHKVLFATGMPSNFDLH